MNSAKNETMTIRAMLNNTTSMSLFLEKNNSKTPVVLSQLSPSKSGTLFFNTNVGSRISDCQHISFKYENETYATVTTIKSNPPTGSFNTIAKIKWLGVTRFVKIGAEKKIEKAVRDGVLGDQSGQIKISIWGKLIEEIEEDIPYIIKNVVTQNYQGLKVVATVNTTVEEHNNNIAVEWEEEVPNSFRIQCAEVLSCKATSFRSCVNIICRRKVVPFPGEVSVTCSSCRRKMLVKRCSESVTVELTVENNNQQIILTVFEKVLKEFIGPLSMETVEVQVLMLEDITITYNNKKVITAMTNIN